MNTPQTATSGSPASDLFGWGDLVAEVTPATAEQVHEWLKQEQEARMHDWQRYQVLLCAARHAVNSGCMGGLSHVLLQLRDPRWKPNDQDVPTEGGENRL